MEDNKLYFSYWDNKIRYSFIIVRKNYNKYYITLGINNCYVWKETFAL